MRTGRPPNREVTRKALDGAKWSPEDEELVRGQCWTRCHGYIVGRPRGMRKMQFLHRLIMKPPPGLFVDHINGDKTDNRRENLRLVTKRQNSMNARKPFRTKKTSKYKGVYKISGRTGERGGGEWVSKIKIHGKNIHIGVFKCETAAAVAYNLKAKELFGDFACLNFGGR